MSEREPDSGGIISRDDIAFLAGWFDASEFALDPLSVEAREAEKKFENGVAALYENKVRPRFPALTLRDFRSGLRHQCIQFLQREKALRRNRS